MFGFVFSNVSHLRFRAFMIVFVLLCLFVLFALCCINIYQKNHVTYLTYINHCLLLHNMSLCRDRQVKIEVCRANSSLYWSSNKVHRDCQTLGRNPASCGLPNIVFCKSRYFWWKKWHDIYIMCLDNGINRGCTTVWRVCIWWLFVMRHCKSQLYNLL